jgi:hypothetical protein
VDLAGIWSTECRNAQYAPGVTEVIVVRSSWRRTLLFACLGTTLGFAAALVRGPQLVSFFFKPLQDSLSCAPTVNTALNQFVGLELASAALGAIFLASLHAPPRRSTAEPNRWLTSRRRRYSPELEKKRLRHARQR